MRNQMKLQWYLDIIQTSRSVPLRILCILLLSGIAAAAAASEESPCDAESGDVPEWIANGGALIVFVGMICCFWGLAHVCDSYFYVALMILCEEHHISDDLAGATVMAVGSSLADLMLSMISLFALDSTLGLGTIIGSQVFNSLVISSACVMSAKNGELILKEGIFTRSVIVYGLSLLCIMAVLHEGSFDMENFDQCVSVDWYSGFLLLLAYGAYVYVVVNHDKICTFFRFSNSNHENRIAIHIPLNPMGEFEELPPEITATIHTAEERKLQKNLVELENYLGGQASDVNKSQGTQVDIQQPTRSVTEFRRVLSLPTGPSEVSKDGQHEQPTLTNKIMFFLEKIVHYMTYPIEFLTLWTIPDVRKEENRRHYALCAFLCVIWLALLAEGLLTCLEELSKVMGLDPTLAGLTIGAWGVSLPTLWGSVIVSKKGFGDMAISNGMGANVFSAFIGLGLPWFSYPLYLKRPYNGIKDDGILPLLLLLFLINIIYYVLLRVYNFTMKFW